MNDLSSDIVKRLRAAGLRITPQRVAVLRALAGRSDHPTAETLWRELSAEMPQAARTTVYATLKRLAALGEIGSLSTVSGPTRYDHSTEFHPHLICRNCGGVEDLEEPFAEVLTVGDRKARARRGFHVDEHRVSFYGTCAACLSEAEASDG